MSVHARELKDRAWFWHFWKITPAEYRSLTIGEHNAMMAVMKDIARQNRKARRKGG